MDSSSALDASEEADALPRLGMWIFIASELLFFGVLLVVYGVSRLHSPAGFAAAGAHTAFWLGTLNTAILLSSSCAVALAAQACEDARVTEARRALWIAATLGCAFLLIKAIEYRQEWHEGLLPGPGFALPAPGAQLFFAWYFFATGLHALHLLIGIALCAGLARHGTPAGRLHKRLPVVALYWHFVDLVWVFLYPLIYLVGPRS